MQLLVEVPAPFAHLGRLQTGLLGQVLYIPLCPNPSRLESRSERQQLRLGFTLSAADPSTGHRVSISAVRGRTASLSQGEVD